MPVLSVFYGIIVRIFKEDQGQHHAPHIHAFYSGKRVVVALDGEVLTGEIPRNKMKLLLAWMEIHQEEIKANWDLISEGEQVFRIEPLR
ncbi:MAG: DUF4160 domain-containing protein [Oscillospiraceae bacterium]|nr:DUF4160 domain-containing protein [Oscillospiraceae bacterium]